MAATAALAVVVGTPELRGLETRHQHLQVKAIMVATGQMQAAQDKAAEAAGLTQPAVQQQFRQQKVVMAAQARHRLYPVAASLTLAAAVATVLRQAPEALEAVATLGQLDQQEPQIQAAVAVVAAPMAVMAAPASSSSVTRCLARQYLLLPHQSHGLLPLVRSALMFLLLLAVVALARTFLVAAALAELCMQLESPLQQEPSTRLRSAQVAQG